MTNLNWGVQAPAGARPQYWSCMRSAFAGTPALGTANRSFTLSIFPRLSSIQRLFFASCFLSCFSGDTVVAEGAAAAEEELTKSALDMEVTWEDDELARRGMGARPSATSMLSAS